MPNPLINQRVIFGNKPPGGYCPQAVALFNKWQSLGTPATTARKIIVNNTILQLISSGIWEEIDVLFMYASHSQNAALVDWKNPNTRLALVVNDYAGAFVADQYFKGNGSNFRINLNYNPGDGSTYNYVQNSASFGVYTVDRVAENKRDVSALNASTQGNELQIISVADTTYSYVNSATQRQSRNYMGTGLSAVKRTGPSSGNAVGAQGYYNGSSYTDSSLAIPNIDFYEFCKNLNGTFSLYTTRKHRYFFAGSGNIDFFQLNNIIEQYYLLPVITAPVKRINLSGNSFTANGTYVEQLLAGLNMYSTLDLNSQGNSGYTTPQCLTVAQSYIFPYIKPTIQTDILFFWELTNDMAANSGNASLCYSNLVTYCQAARAAMPNAKIIVGTMLPRNSQPNRQNDADLFDITKLNGMIRTNLVADGYADAICDVAADLLMGQNGQNTDLTYYNADQIHPNATGYQRLVTNYIQPSIQAYL